MRTDVSRRCFMSAATAACGMLSVSGARAAAPAPAADSTFRYALNAATLRGYKLLLSEQIVLTAQAGYTGIEPWVDDIAKAAAGGTPLNTLKRQCADAGLSVISAISFAAWAVDDDAARAKHRRVRLAGGDVLPPERLVERNGCVNLAHDRSRPFRETAAPHLVGARNAPFLIASAHACHCPYARRVR